MALCAVRRLIYKNDKVVSGLEENVLAWLKLMSKLLFVFEDMFSSGLSGVAAVKKKRCSQLSCCLSCLLFVSSHKSDRWYQCCSLSGISDIPPPKMDSIAWTSSDMCRRRQLCVASRAAPWRAQFNLPFWVRANVLLRRRGDGPEAPRRSESELSDLQCPELGARDKWF